MQYSKPEIVISEEGVDAIQGQTLKSLMPSEGNPNSLLSTAPAYDADE